MARDDKLEEKYKGIMFKENTIDREDQLLNANDENCTL